MIFLTIWLIMGILVWAMPLFNEIFLKNGDSDPLTTLILVCMSPILIIVWPLTLLVFLVDVNIL